ncbi:MAG: glycosyltransferase [Planctomycetes bacterium]|nr:glycosyltransferase [Planctomycetota bacterium]
MTDAPIPKISLVIPAWNEAAYLPRLLATVAAARARFRGGAESIEVIVADNGSTDDTAAIARAAGCRVTHVARRAIAAARNGGAAVARGEIIAFVDADYRIHPETFNFIEAVLARPDYAGGGTGATMERWSLGIRFTWCAVLPPLWMLGVDGGVWFCRRADFHAAGGYDESIRASEDVRFLLALKRLGRRRRPLQRLATRFTARRLGVPRAFAIVSCRKFDRYGDWHFLPLVLRGTFWFIVSRRGFDRFVQGYWYEGREADKA